MLDIEKLKGDIQNAILNAQAKALQAQDVNSGMEVFVNELAKAIDNYIRSGDVKTTGTASAQMGKVT